MTTASRARRCHFCQRSVDKEDLCRGCKVHVCEDCDDGVPVGMKRHGPETHQAVRKERSDEARRARRQAEAFGQECGAKAGLVAHGLVDIVFGPDEPTSRRR